MSMKFVPQTIQIHCAFPDVTQSIEAMVGVGTGLAYHPVVSRPDLFALTHVQSGYGITPLTMPTEAEIQAFLECVAELDPDRWQIDLVTLKRRYNTNMRVQIELAHYDACSPYSIFLYAEDTDGELIPESSDAVEDPQAASNLVLVAEIFASGGRNVGRVRLVRMHGGTGQHETLHLYTRAELKPCGLFSLLAHLFQVALVALEIDPDQVEGEVTLEIDSTVACGLCTVEVNGSRVCLWDFNGEGHWEAYSITSLTDAGAEQVQEEEVGA